MWPRYCRSCDRRGLRISRSVITARRVRLTFNDGSRRTSRLSEAAQKQVSELATAIDRLGLTELGQSMGLLATAESPAEQVLRCGYLSRLHAQVATAMLE
jgi:hypothetical protein